MDEPQAIGSGIVILCTGIAAGVTAIARVAEATLQRFRNGKANGLACGANGKTFRVHCETLARHDEAIRNMAAGVARIEERVDKIADHLLDSRG